MAAPEKPQFKQEVDKAVAQLRTLRDEIRLHLHLAGKDAQEAWNKLEPSLGELEQKLGQVTDATKARAQDLLKRFGELRDRVRALERAGFIVIRQAGSHVALRHGADATRRATVPVHGSKPVRPDAARDPQRGRAHRRGVVRARGGR